MSTQGKGTYVINSGWSSGSLVFYEKAVGRTATGDVLTIGAAAVTIGGTSQDVDFGWYATGSKSFVLDAGAGTMTLAGLDVTITGDLTIDTEDIALGDNDSLEFGDGTDVTVTWNGTNLAILPATDNTGIIEVGVDSTKAMDVKLYGATANSYMLWDNSDDRLEFDGADINLQDADILQFGDAQDVAITWDATNLTIIPATDNTGEIQIGNDGTKSMNVRFYGATASYAVLWDMDGDTNGMWNFGADDYGVDVKFFGQTASCYAHYDASEDKLSIVQTNAATSGVETCFNNAMTLTGIGASAEAAVNSITINAAAGTYTNALCARTTYGASGKTTGYSGVICAEMNTSAGCTDGTYVLYEAEAIMAASSGVGTAYSVFGVNASGANVAAFDTSAYLFDIQGVTSASGKFWYANKSAPFDAYLRIRVGDTPYYIGVLAQQAAAS